MMDMGNFDEKCHLFYTAFFVFDETLRVMI